MKIDVDSRDFFKDPFTETELKKIIKMTGKKPISVMDISPVIGMHAGIGAAAISLMFNN